MDSTQGEAFLRAHGATDAAMTAMQQQADQATAGADEFITMALAFRECDDPQQVMTISLHMRHTALVHGTVPTPIIDIIQALAMRCADTALEVQRLTAAIAAVDGEQA